MTELETLQRLEAEINREQIAYLPPLPCDQWIASSAWQKAIRRGDEQTALRAASSLWQQDRRAFWRRCMLVAGEDVGIGCIKVVAEILIACTSGRWRMQVGDLKVALYLTQKLARANKSRLAEQMYTILSHDSQYDGLKHKLRSCTNRELAEVVIRRKAPLTERALALWLMAGANCFPSDKLPHRTGSIAAAIECLETLPGVVPIMAASRVAALKTEYPLTLFLPLLVSAYGARKKLLNVALPDTDQLEGIPLLGLDQYTRLGKTCIRDFIADVPALKEFNTVQVGMGVFYIEGRVLKNEITSPIFAQFKNDAELADMGAVGLCMPRMLGLQETLALNFDRLQQIRRKRLRLYLDSWASNSAGIML